jgi:hypothetical protein
MNQNIQINIPIAWEYVRMVRQQVTAALAEYSEELRSAAVMVASELVENAIKYGTSIPAMQWAQFRFKTTAEHIQIQVSNGLNDLRLLEAVQQIIEQTKTAGRSEQLYVARLQELMNNPTQSTRLGLYRISHEGKFDLDYSYGEQILELTARRRIL